MGGKSEKHVPALIPRASPGAGRSGRVWSVTAVAICASVALFAYGRSGKHAAPAALVPAGWYELGPCADTLSLDGHRTLLLSQDRSAELHEDHGAGGPAVTIGTWAYDPSARSYLVTLDGMTRAYSLLELENVATCLLLSGNTHNADLTRSWFSWNDDGIDIDIGRQERDE